MKETRMTAGEVIGDLCRIVWYFGWRVAALLAAVCAVCVLAGGEVF